MRRLPLLLLIVLLSGSARPSPAVAAGGPPALVVILVVDQMRRDYIEDYGAPWTGGLRRLLNEGAWFTNAAYPYLATLTCPGHATIATGSLPSTHGIISNQWWDRASQQLISCTTDPTSKEVPYGADRPPGSGGSGRLLAVPTLAGVLADTKPVPGQVVALSLKRPASAMLSGMRGNPVIWRQGGGWSSSTTYAGQPDKTTMKFLIGNPIERDFGAAWNREGKKSDYKYDDNGVGEKPTVEWNAEFPHLLQPRSGQRTTFFYQAWEESPFADAYLGRLAAAIVDGLKLGKGPATDYLAVSFSALDIVGHDFGPRSHEVQDVLRRLDDTIGTLMTQLDKKIGRDRYVLALSADHGVATIPEQLKAEGQDAGRVKMAEIMSLVDGVVSKKFGNGRWVAIQAYSEFYFRAGVYDRITADPDLLAELIRTIESQPGVHKVYDGRTLRAADGSSLDAVGTAAARSYFPERSGDLLITLKPNWIFVADDKSVIPGNATTHGSPYPYDQQVPMVLFGSGIKPGRYEQAATPADIAPTLARICGVALPRATGRVLDEALVPSPSH
jgi:predicted AlkP superfamily pyrophosphatase or phosphodiesterase